VASVKSLVDQLKSFISTAMEESGCTFKDRRNDFPKGRSKGNRSRKHDKTSPVPSFQLDPFPLMEVKREPALSPATVHEGDSRVFGDSKAVECDAVAKLCTQNEIDLFEETDFHSAEDCSD
jgi:hypothetical protein